MCCKLMTPATMSTSSTGACLSTEYSPALYAEASDLYVKGLSEDLAIPYLHARHPASDICTLARYDIGAPQQIPHVRFQGAAHVCMQIRGDAWDAMVCSNAPRL